MSQLVIGVLGIIALVVLLFMRMPIAVAMGAIGVVGMSLVVGLDAGLSILKTAPFSAIARYGFSVVPLFILMGSFCFHAGISRDRTLGILIPPSVVLVIYGILTEQSIGALFLAGFIPGLLEAIFYIITISIVCRINPLAGPAGPRASLREKILSFKDTWPVLLLFIVVIGGIYTGIFSPTEAAGIGAFFALLIALGKRKLNVKKFFSSLEDTMKSTAMIFTILIGAMLLGYFMTVTRLPFELANIVSGLEFNRYVVFALIIAVYVILGCVMIPMAMVILTIPIVFPLVTAQGFDPIWFGIITVRIFEIAQITPPVGMNVFVIRGVAGDIPMGTIYKGIIPFFLSDICHLTLLIIFPQIALFLPNLMG
jgi:tripartite ATP-independent transporter DctM subunit